VCGHVWRESCDKKKDTLKKLQRVHNGACIAGANPPLILTHSSFAHPFAARPDPTHRPPPQSSFCHSSNQPTFAAFGRSLSLGDGLNVLSSASHPKHSSTNPPPPYLSLYCQSSNPNTAYQPTTPFSLSRSIVTAQTTQPLQRLPQPQQFSALTTVSSMRCPATASDNYGTACGSKNEDNKIEDTV
jgi:hypothetical protein